MICPRCQSELPTDAIRCASCDHELVANSTIESSSSSLEPVEVMATKDLSLIPILRSILDGAEIPYEIRGDQNFSLQPAFDLLIGRERAPILILVPQHRADEAKALLETPDPSAFDG